MKYFLFLFLFYQPVLTIRPTLHVLIKSHRFVLFLIIYPPLSSFSETLDSFLLRRRRVLLSCNWLVRPLSPILLALKLKYDYERANLSGSLSFSSHRHQPSLCDRKQTVDKIILNRSQWREKLVSLDNLHTSMTPLAAPFP